MGGSSPSQEGNRIPETRSRRRHRRRLGALWVPYQPRSPSAASLPEARAAPAKPTRLLGTDDLEVFVHEDVMRPVDSDYVEVVIAGAQQHDTVDGASSVR